MGRHLLMGNGDEKAPRRFPLRLITRRGLIRIACLLALLGILGFWGGSCMISMPGKSHTGPLPPLEPAQEELAAALRRDVEELAGRIGIRNVYMHDNLCAAADYLEKRLGATGLPVKRLTFKAGAQEYHNLEVELEGRGTPREIVVVGAHYDSAPACPGANDNGTGVAGLLALAERFAAARPERTLRFVAFPNEEPPFFMTENMGSLVYARGCKERGEKVVAMLALETIGCFTDAPKSQHYPPPFGFFYPSTGNFIAFVGNLSSRKLVRRAVGTFRKGAAFPSEGGALPSWIAGVGWSDHWSFWQQGYPALMVTDTAPFRYAEYHTTADTPERIDYERCARVVDGLAQVIRDLAGVR